MPAARLAALRRSERGASSSYARRSRPTRATSGRREQFVYNADFHTSVIAAAGNAFLMMAAQPLFTILQTQPRPLVARRALPQGDQRAAPGDRRGDREPATHDAAEREMRSHLEFLRPHYERTWRYAMRAAEQA